MSGPVKLDPVWLDTCVVSNVNNGDKIAEHFLQLLHEEGYELLIVPAVNNELLNGNPLTMKGNKPVWEQVPTEASRATLEALKVRLGIKVDTSSGAIPWKTRALYAMQGHIEPGKDPKTGKPLAVPRSLDAISESDSLVLGQVMASAQARKIANPIMVTGETGQKAMLSQSHLYKVTAIKVPPLGGSELTETLAPNGGKPGSSRAGGSGTPGPSSPSSGLDADVAPTNKASLPVARVVKGGLPSGKITAISITIGRLVISVGATLLLQYLAQILMQKITKNLIDQRMKEFEPEIQRFATAYGRMIIENVASGTAAYVTSRVRIEYPIQYAQAGGSLGVDVIASLPLTNLDALWITERDHTGESKHTLGGGFGNQTDVHEYTFSVSIGSQITKEQVATYRAVNAQIKLYQMALRNAVNAMASRADIQSEIQQLMDALDETFGGSFHFAPDRKLWTEEGYDAMVGATGGVVYSGLPEMRM
jgi:hypothetical protein